MRTSSCVEKYEDAADTFVRNMMAIGRSEKTVHVYRVVLTDFRNFYDSEKIEGMKKDKWSYYDPSFTTVQAWRDSLMDRGLAPSTVREYLTKLGAFFGFATDPAIAIYEKNPVSTRLYPDTSREMKRPYELPLTNDQIAMLWSCEKPPESERGKACNWERNYAIVMLLITSKIRNAELLSLTPNDLDWEVGEIQVNRGKGNKYRVAPFTEIAQQAVKMYLASGERPASATDNDPLFGNCGEKRFGGSKIGAAFHSGSTQWLSDIIEHHVFIITGVHGVRSHDLRHLGAYLDLNVGKRLEELQAELGHAQPSTTQLYSGRLTGKRNRGDVKRTIEEQRYQIERNNAVLQRIAAAAG